jgi:hypothetical protein
MKKIIVITFLLFSGYSYSCVVEDNGEHNCSNQLRVIEKNDFNVLEEICIKYNKNQKRLVDSYDNINLSNMENKDQKLKKIKRLINDINFICKNN